MTLIKIFVFQACLPPQKALLEAYNAGSQPSGRGGVGARIGVDNINNLGNNNLGGNNFG